MTEIKNKKYEIVNESETEIDLYYVLHDDATKYTARWYYENFPNLDVEMLLLLEQASRGEEDMEEQIIKMSQEIYDERTNEFLKFFGKN